MASGKVLLVLLMQITIGSRYLTCIEEWFSSVFLQVGETKRAI